MIKFFQRMNIMSIKREFYAERSDGVSLYRTYSDKGFIIKKEGTNERYEEAIDIENCGFEYSETESLIKDDE